MDIVSRLKEFINHAGVAVTQFADNCKIPRPTLSQLLNGRNKKVSDELITKIHEAYPSLSVMWLMFGEGNMIAQGQPDTATHQPQVNSLFGFNGPVNTDDNDSETSPRIEFEKSFSEQDAPATAAEDFLPGINSTPLNLKESSTPGTDSSTITFKPYAKRKIVNIIVYYDDNSFESFVPGQKKRP